jgi:hypothetical protein
VKEGLVTASSLASLTHDEIAQLAFGFYETHRPLEGNRNGEWLRAEQELVWHSAYLRSADEYTRRVEK